MKKIVFSGGGSAGHVIPNVALIQELKEKYQLYYIGTDGIEQTIVRSVNVPFYSISCPKLIRGFSLSNLSIPIRFLSAIRQAESILRELSPDLVFSKGGFVALPVVFAAHRLGIPAITHESDLSLGLANRLMAKKCKYVLTSFEEVARSLPNGKYTGSPMRSELFTATSSAANKRKPTLLVLGGGSGSKAINEAVRNHLPELLKKYKLIHICGQGNRIEWNGNRKATGTGSANGYEQIEFTSDMGAVYARADGVLCRAGSNTVFEVLALKKPTVFVPLQNKRSRGDQVKNAEYFQEKGLCRILYERELETLPTAVDLLFQDKNLRSALQKCNIKSGNEEILFYIDCAVR